MDLRQRRLLERREQRWSRSYNANDPFIQQLAQREARDSRRLLRIGILVGVLVHVVVFLITFPKVTPKVYRIGQGTRVYQVRQFRFQPPPPQRARPSAPRRPEAKRIPIPDPTPDEPEPLAREDSDAVGEAEFPEADFFGTASIPAGPPGPSQGVLPIAGNVRAPVRLYAPDPVYPEEARQAHVQGVVILQTIIDTRGGVTDIRVLKGLPSGLTEAAVAAVSQWRFDPATLDGKPVAVYYLVTITFSVQ